MSLTRKARDRAYRVQLWALSEEQKVMGPMPPAVWASKAQEIWEACYGDLPERLRPPKLGRGSP